METKHDTRVGLGYGAAAYVMWGVMPLFFRALGDVNAFELLAHRVVWSAVLLAGLLTWLRRWPLLRECLARPRTRWFLLASTLLIGVNWFVFIYGVSTRQVVQNSLGYFINPLLNVLLGVALFRERPRPAQWAALALATAGVAYLVVGGGSVPWISFALAVSFALYGVVRKLAPVETLTGLGVETFALAPAAAALLAWWGSRGEARFGTLGWQTDVLLLLTGVATTAPLFCFGQAARKLPLTTLGFMQFVTPTMQFLTAVMLFGEDFGRARQVSFALIWAALALVTFDSLRPRAKPAD